MYFLGFAAKGILDPRTTTERFFVAVERSSVLVA
jgi:hypothetical protein